MSAPTPEAVEQAPSMQDGRSRAATDSQGRRGPRHRRAPRPGRTVLYLVLVAYCLTSAGAMLWVVGLSLKSNPEFLSTSPWSLPADAQFGNYVVAWQRAEVGRFFLNSFVLTTGSAVTLIVISSMAAYALSRIEFRGRGALMGMFVFGLMIPGFLLIIPLYTLLRQLDLLGTLWGVGVVYVATTMPFNIFILSGYFRSLPLELEEAAFVDGASPTRTFFQVMMPLAAPAITSVAILNFLNFWNEFIFALVFLTDRSTFTLPLGLFRLATNAEYSAQWVEMFAGLVISIVPVLVIFAFAQERITRSLSASIKG